MSVDEAQQRISSREFSEWIAYSQLEPFTDQRLELMIAQLTAIVANIASKGKAYKIEDFLLKIDAEHKERKSPQQMLAVFKTFAEAQKAGKPDADRRKTRSSAGR